MPSEERSKETLRFVVTPDGELFGRDSDEGRELARRIHACFVACEGIATEDLEQGIIADMRRVIVGVQPLLKERQQSSDAA
jgi:hypothetical protein